MDSTNVQKTSIPNSSSKTHSAKSCEERQLIDKITHLVTPTIDEVADWHFTDVTLFDDWERPLLRVLRFFVEDGLPTETPKRVIDIRLAEPAGIAA